MKKYLITICLILISCTKIHASIEGRLFLEVDVDSKNVTASLEKIYDKDIAGGNIRSAFFKTSSSNSNITDLLKKALNENEKSLKLERDFEFCFKDCKSNQFPHILIAYSFNRPPDVNLISPKNNDIIEEKEILLRWEGKDSDGKFLEYSVEVCKDGFFNNNIREKTPWSLDTSYILNLERGKYFWRVHVRDNSFVKNEVVSKTLNFEIKREPLLEPIILFPKEGFLTNQKILEFKAKTDKKTNNYIFLNNELVADLISSEIVVEIELKREGKNVVEIVSKREEEETKKSVVFFTKWTPPSTPEFEFKLEGEETFVRILNKDYEKVYVYINENLFLELLKTAEWISLGYEIYGDTEIGISLEDEVGNKTEIVYKKFTPEDEVLGIGASGQRVAPLPWTILPNMCIYKYNSTHKRFESRRCFIKKPELLKIESTTRDRKTFNINLAGFYNSQLVILVDEYRCRLPFVCAEKFVKRSKIETKPHSSVNIHLDGTFTRPNERQTLNDNLFIARYVKNTRPTGRRVNFRYSLHHSFRYENQWVNVNLESPFSDTRIVPPAIILPNKSSNGIYRFPFSRNIGVTQWHGYTAFQSPHTGIDFGSYREPVYAIGDGIIREAKWDNYSGTCLSGGYFVRIEHDNGMHSVYLHLENYKKSNGHDWRVGQRIRRGELIGRTGNTGAYNCQPLGYHLHFELRKRSPQSTHTNPVPYINVNWDNIHTLNHTRYPGRLTGNNPHPTW